MCTARGGRQAEVVAAHLVLAPPPEGGPTVEPTTPPPLVSASAGEHEVDSPSGDNARDHAKAAANSDSAAVVVVAVVATVEHARGEWQAKLEAFWRARELHSSR